MALGAPVEPLARLQRIHMTPPQGPCMVCPPSSLIDVDMTAEVPTPPLVVADNDMVKALRVESDHKRELDLVRMEHTNEVQGLKARIELTKSCES